MLMAANLNNRLKESEMLSQAMIYFGTYSITTSSMLKPSES